MCLTTIPARVNRKAGPYRRHSYKTKVSFKYYKVALEYELLLYRLRPCICQKILLFRESWKSKFFDGRKSSKIKSSFFRFRESLIHTTKSFKNLDICQKFWYIFDIFDIQWYMSKIDVIFLKLLTHSLSKMLKIVGFGQK